MMKEGHKHYSEKGGHKERSDFWKDVRKMIERSYKYSPNQNLNFAPQSLPPEEAFNIRRGMLRDPRDGRR